MKKIIESIRIYFVLFIILGILYPLSVTLIAQMTMSDKANGSLIKKEGSVVGSKLIGQEFNGSKYFHGRPSVNNYDAGNSGASNLGPSSKKLMDIVSERINRARLENNMNSNVPVPADMVLASGSGLDPHISVYNAVLQVPRIALSRGLSEEIIKEYIYKNIDPDFLGIWGSQGVNVLKLNIALDNLSQVNQYKTAGEANEK